VTAARLLSALASGAARRPLLVIAVVAVLAAGGGVLALGLRPTAATDTLIGRSSSTFQATQRFYRNFGDEAVVVMIRGHLNNWLLTSDLERELSMEGCISGHLPAQGITVHGGAQGPCGQLARSRLVKVVFGPGTFINESVAQLVDQFNSQSQNAQTQSLAAYRYVYAQAIAKHMGRAAAVRLGNAARNLIITQFEQTLITAGTRFGLTSLPAINDPHFVRQLVFDPLQPVGTPKQRFAYLFPNADTAIITVRLRPGLSEAQRSRAIGLIRGAVAMPDWAPQQGQSYRVTGEPVIVSDLTGSITQSLKLLLLSVLVVMAATLALVFRGRPRLLPLAVALAATGLTFGVLALSGSSLTMASIGVLPVLIGLAVDYAIQFQSRVQEAGEFDGDTRAAVRRAAAVGGPTIVTAAAATAGGFLMLALSPVPMVRGFGLLLVGGIAAGLLCAFTAGSAALVLASRDPSARGPRGARALGVWRGGRARGRGVLAGPWQAGARVLARAWRGAREIVLENRAGGRLFAGALDQGLRRPGRVLAIGLALAALGWVLDSQTPVQTDISRLVPQKLTSLRNLNALEKATGVGGEIDVMVSSPNLVSPTAVNWMNSYQQRVLRRFGYSDASTAKGCGRAQLCPAFSLPSLFASTGGAPATLDAAAISGLLSAVPAYFSQGVITPDHHTATLAFGIRLMPLGRQQAVIDQMRRLLHPPAGVRASLVGLPVLAAQANAAVASPWRRALTLVAGLAAVALVLLLAFRADRRRALVPLVPIVMATGWSALILFAIRVPLNPMSVTMGALVIAVSTEFSVLLSERYRQERAAGWEPAEALQRTYRHTGSAVLASGATAIVGFAVLVLSDISMLRGFGFVTVVDLTVSLLGVMVVLPSALLRAERGELLRLRGRRPRGLDVHRRIGRAHHEPA
jgi:hydrophobe/amphiphile efflux-3 (HAE3) family protein